MAPQQQPTQVEQEAGFSVSGPASPAQEIQAQAQSSGALKKIFSELIEPARGLLEKYGAKDAEGLFICSDTEAEGIKKNMVAVLNLPPQRSSIAIYYLSKTGSATTRNEAGEEIMRGLITLDRSPHARLKFEYNISTGTLTLDGKPALRQEVPVYCSKATNTSLMVDTVVKRESTTKLDRWHSLKAGDGKIVVLTASNSYPGGEFNYEKYFHFYIVTEKVMYPVQIESAEVFRDGGSTFVNGSFTDEKGQKHYANLHIPSPLVNGDCSLTIDGVTQRLDTIKAGVD